MYPLHACATLEEQSKVFSATVPGYRKVNIFKSLLFLKHVKPFAKVVIADNNVFKY